jgi:hypothetical protein
MYVSQISPFRVTVFVCLWLLAVPLCAQETLNIRTYDNRLVKLENPQSILADYPEFIQPIEEETRYEAAPILEEEGADLEVRAWRYSYNARGIIEMPNRIRMDQTAVVMVHPWGIDDEHGWITPEPAGVADFCTPRKNHLAAKHTSQVVDPFLQSLRGKAAFIMYSLPGKEDAIRKQLYRSVRTTPSEADRQHGSVKLALKLKSFAYRGQAIHRELKLSAQSPVADYFRQFPGLDAGPEFNNAGFWELPIPVTTSITVDPHDVVIYDDEGYEPMKKFLKTHGVKHVLLTGYATDMCFCRTTAGYENLSKDFNVFLVGDATLATFPASKTPKYATNAHLAFAALDHLITQISWIKQLPEKTQSK